MLKKQHSAIIYLSFVILFSILVSSCIKDRQKNDKTADITDTSATNTPAATTIPAATIATETINTTATGVTLSPTPTDAAENIITVHNATQLAANIGSGRHIRLMPGSDYEISGVYPDGGLFQKLNDLTLEGVGETPVSITTENLQSVVMSFSNCSNITLINLKLSHTEAFRPNDSCEGRVLTFYGDNKNITIKNCIISGCGTTGLFTTGINNLICENTVFRDCSMSLMNLWRVNNASFEKCTFEADRSSLIEIMDSSAVTFTDCLFTGDYNNRLPYISVDNRDKSLLETSDRSFYGKLIAMEQEEYGILIRNSILTTYDSTELMKQLKENLSSLLPGYSFDIDISKDERIDASTNIIDDIMRIHMKAPFVFSDIKKEFQHCFENIMLSMKDLISQKTELLLELGPVYASYPHFDEMLERCRNGEKVSFLETDYIHFGELDAELIDPGNKKYLSASKAREILLNKIPLPVSTNDFKPFTDITAIETRAPMLIYDDGCFLYLYSDLSYGTKEKFGYDGFCIDAADGSLKKFHEDRYVEVSAADKTLLARISAYLEESGVVVPKDDWIKVQIYDNRIASVYIGTGFYFQLKLNNTSEGTLFERCEIVTMTAGEDSPDIAGPPRQKTYSINQWNDIYNLQWVFDGEMKHHWILGKVGDILLVYGHDGGISGYHDHEYLYGLDTKTGKKIWSVYGGYLRVCYSVFREQGKVFAAYKTHDANPLRLLCLDIYTGNILWEKELTATNSYPPDHIQVLSGDSVAFLLHYHDPDKSVLMVLDRANGNLLWEKNIDKDDRLVEFNYDTPCLILRQKDRTQALDWITGKSLWAVPDSGWTVKQFNREGAVTKSPDNNFGADQPTKRWLAFESEFRYIDLLSGQVLCSVGYDNKVRKIMPLSHEYSLILDYHKEPVFIGKVESISLYSISEKKVLWTKKDELIGAVLNNDDLCYITDSKIKSVNVLTGVVNWSRPFSANIDFSPLLDNHFIQPLFAGGKIIASEKGVLFVFDPDTGERLYQVGDYAIENYMLGGYMDSFCSMVSIDGMLYIGSGSGRLCCLKIEP